MNIVDWKILSYTWTGRRGRLCKRWKCSLLIQTLESEQYTKEMVILSEHDWCP